MPAPQIFETVQSQAYRKGYAGGDLTAEWVVWYEPTLAAAEAQVWATVDNPLDLGYGDMEVKGVQGRNMGAPDLWLFTVLYGSSAPGGKLRPDQLTFRIVGVEAHITNSIATLDARQAADAAVSGANLAVDGALDTRVTPDGYTPTAADIGDYVAVTGGTGFTTGLYQIVNITGGGSPEWVLASSPAAGGTGGGVWTLLNGTAPRFGGAIGTSLDAVQGCDVLVPAMEFTLSQNYPGGIGLTDLIAFRAVVGKVNQAPCGPFATGTLEYLGCEPSSAEGSVGANQDFVFWNLAHRFKYEPDVFNTTVGSIAVPYKPGHAYLWVRYVPAVTANVLGTPPAQVNVEQVKYSADFTTLGVTF